MGARQVGVMRFDCGRLGGDVILVARKATKVHALAAELHQVAPGQQVESVVVDFTAADAAQQVFAAVQALGWPVEYLINNAGFGGGGAHGVVEIIFTGDGGARTRANFKRGVRRGVVPRTGTSNLLCNQGVLGRA